MDRQTDDGNTPSAFRPRGKRTFKHPKLGTTQKSLLGVDIWPNLD